MLVASGQKARVMRADICPVEFFREPQVGRKLSVKRKANAPMYVERILKQLVISRSWLCSKPEEGSRPSVIIEKKMKSLTVRMANTVYWIEMRSDSTLF